MGVLLESMAAQRVAEHGADAVRGRAAGGRRGLIVPRSITGLGEVPRCHCSARGTPIALSSGVAPTRRLRHPMDSVSTLQSRRLTVEPRNNRLLAALPVADLQRWRPQLELVSMPAGTSLSRCGEFLSHVHFPTTASVSMLHTTPAGESVEVIAVGSEGVVGIPVIMGVASAPGDAVVRTGGHGFRLRSSWLQSEFHSCPAAMRLLLRYTQAVMTHTAQAAICNKLHSLEQRVCRCFLSSLDGVNGAPVNLTHESMSGMLGVRREGVTCTALKLQRAGIIDYTRGRVAVLDRPGLEALSCECYRVVKNEYDRFLPGSSPSEGSPAPRMEPSHETLTTFRPPLRPAMHAVRSPSSAMAD